MYKKAPPDYDCPFCKIVESDQDELDHRGEEIVYRDTEIMAFISSHWFPEVNGPILIIPNKHFENVFDIPDELLVKIVLLSKKIAIAMKESYGCEGVSFRQHNIAGNQSVFHYHLQVLPRHDGDNLYQNHDKKYYVEPAKRRAYAAKIKEALS